MNFVEVGEIPHDSPHVRVAHRHDLVDVLAWRDSPDAPRQIIPLKQDTCLTQNNRNWMAEGGFGSLLSTSRKVDSKSGNVGYKMTPLIGVATYGRAEKEVNNPAFRDHFCAPALYVDAIRRAGGSVVLLPPGETDFDAWLNALDGVILSGGADISPGLYGGNAGHPELTQTFLDRDESELRLTSALLGRKDIPCLFICRGLQVLNVALGGSLIEHIADNGQPDIHRAPGTFWIEQPVEVHSDTLLSRAVVKSSIVTISGHHQGIRNLGADLTVSAVAEDGIIEAVEVTGHRFKLGVQWHPEASAATDPDQQGIFNSFVAAAADRARASSSRSVTPS